MDRWTRRPLAIGLALAASLLMAPAESAVRTQHNRPRPPQEASGGGRARSPARLWPPWPRAAASCLGVRAAAGIVGTTAARGSEIAVSRLRTSTAQLPA
jgi:hypothetical protein